jgi:hypothetical protein
LGSHEPGDTPWWRGCRRLRSNLIGDDPQSVSLQVVEKKVLSRGIIGKSAPILAEITIRKSHPLEGSRQEAIPLPSTTFNIFSVAFHLAHSAPDWLCQTHPCFHSRGVGSVRRTSHPSGSRPRDVSRLRQTSAPGTFNAPENPRFPAVSNRVQRTDVVAPSWVHLFPGSQQRRRTTPPSSSRPSMKG